MKKIFIETKEGSALINADSVQFQTNISAGKIYCAPSLSAKAGTDIMKLFLGQYTFEGKRYIVTKVFRSFIKSLNNCKEILTIICTGWEVIFKDDDEVLEHIKIAEIKIPKRTTKSYSAYDYSAY